MPIQCLTAGRMTMTATVLHQTDITKPPGDIDVENYGEWVENQDPLTGDVISIWQPFTSPVKPLPGAPAVGVNIIKCIARGIVDGGIRVAGTTERFGDTYENIDYVKMWVPAGTKISKRDRVTNLRDPRGNIIWRDEEFSEIGEPYAQATVFNVNGVTPLFNAFNRNTEDFVLLERATVYGESTTL